MWDYLFQIALGLFIGAAVTIVTAAIIDEVVLRNEIKKKYEDAAKAIINSAEAKVVYVDIYDNGNNKIGDMEIKSEKGVSKSLYKGKRIDILKT